MSIGSFLDRVINNAIVAIGETAEMLLNRLAPFNEVEAQQFLTMGAADALADMEAEQEQWEPDELWAATLHNNFAVGEYPPLDSAPGLQPPVERMADASAASAGPGPNDPPGSGLGHPHSDVNWREVIDRTTFMTAGVRAATNPATSDLLADAADWLNTLYAKSDVSGEDYLKHICPLINQLRRRADDLRIFTK